MLFIPHFVLPQNIDFSIPQSPEAPKGTFRDCKQSPRSRASPDFGSLPIQKKRPYRSRNKDGYFRGTTLIHRQHFFGCKYKILTFMSVSLIRAITSTTPSQSTLCLICCPYQSLNFHHQISVWSSRMYSQSVIYAPLISRQLSVCLFCLLLVPFIAFHI